MVFLLNSDFYKFFWPELRAEILSSFPRHFAFHTGSLSISQCRGVISLIPKKDKDKSLLENLRPISLLNVDYKTLTKIIEKRIEKVLPKIINPNQRGYLKGRLIGAKASSPITVKMVATRIASSLSATRVANS